MEIIKLYTHEKGEEKDGFQLKLAPNNQFNNLSQPSLAAGRELDDLKRGLRSVSAQRFSENTKLSRKINADCDSWLTSTTMKTYNSNAERGVYDETLATGEMGNEAVSRRMQTLTSTR